MPRLSEANVGVFLLPMTMKKISIHTISKRMLADTFTPVGIYLRLRDRFRDTILLESTDNQSAEKSHSFICINAIGGIEIRNGNTMEYKLPGQKPEKLTIGATGNLSLLLKEFMDRFDIEINGKQDLFAQQLYGYTAYDSVQFFESIQLQKRNSNVPDIPLMRYRLYQYIIVINHFSDELFLCENKITGIESETELVESLIQSKDIPQYPFSTAGPESSNMEDEDYIKMTRNGIAACHRGDVFQIVLSRRFNQSFKGDEFNVYRALRSINPSPYLFFFDYGDYKLMGSSPESQLRIENGIAVLHPIAGTFKRTGDEQTDKESAERLMNDAKENAEHVMLVDLARNDLSRLCDEVEVAHYRQVQFFSHVIHLVSEVRGKLKDAVHPFELLAKTFPAGTLSGAPKVRAMQLIDEWEPTSRSFYGGAIGAIGFNGNCNHAIMIRTFLSRNNQLTCQAGAGIVAASVPENELMEVNNKLGALKKAISDAVTPPISMMVD
jgi:anthranilate synthase component 1